MNLEEKQDKLRAIVQKLEHRYELIPKKALNKVTVAGIRDKFLGKVRKGTGKPVGSNIWRVNYPSPHTKSDYPRVCYDPNGYANKTNPHFEIPEFTVTELMYAQKFWMFNEELVAMDVRAPISGIWTKEEDIEAVKKTCLVNLEFMDTSEEETYQIKQGLINNIVNLADYVVPVAANISCGCGAVAIDMSQKVLAEPEVFNFLCEKIINNLTILVILIVLVVMILILYLLILSVLASYVADKLLTALKDISNFVANANSTKLPHFEEILAFFENIKKELYM